MILYSEFGCEFCNYVFDCDEYEGIANCADRKSTAYTFIENENPHQNVHHLRRENVKNTDQQNIIS